MISFDFKVEDFTIQNKINWKDLAIKKKFFNLVNLVSDEFGGKTFSVLITFSLVNSYVHVYCHQIRV